MSTFKDVSPFALISAHWSPTISPIISRRLYARLSANSPAYAPSPSPFVLGSCSEEGDREDS